jgi:hypothetical protein
MLAFPVLRVGLAVLSSQVTVQSAAETEKLFEVAPSLCQIMSEYVKQI